MSARSSPLLVADDARLVTRLRRCLDDAGYSESGLRAVLDGEGAASRFIDVAVARRRVSPDTALGALVQLLLLGASIGTREARRALAPIPLGDLTDVGLLERQGDTVRARVRLVVYDGLILACDRLPASRARLPRDYVDGVTAPTRLLAALTVRRRGGSALDIGTGSGIQALLAARHCRRVIATDVNPRALTFARFNARLNGASAVECRLGSCFEPAHGERFDLVVANPPYVVSPESALAYRDSGEPADSFCRRLVRQAPAHLREGGWAVVLVNWTHRGRAAWWTPLRHWVGGTGFDAWLLHFESLDALGYAAAWNAPLRAKHPAAYAAALDRWQAYYRRLGIEAIAAGAILLRRRTAGPNWLRTDEVAAARVRRAGGQLRRLAATQDYLAALRSNRPLLGQRLRRGARHREERVSGWSMVGLELLAGIPFHTVVSPDALAVFDRCDGRRRLGDLLSRPARGRLLPVIRRLLRLGFLARAGTP